MVRPIGLQPQNISPIYANGYDLINCAGAGDLPRLRELLKSPLLESDIVVAAEEAVNNDRSECLEALFQTGKIFHALDAIFHHAIAKDQVECLRVIRPLIPEGCLMLDQGFIAAATSNRIQALRYLAKSLLSPHAKSQAFLTAWQNRHFDALDVLFERGGYSDDFVWSAIVATSVEDLKKLVDQWDIPEACAVPALYQSAKRGDIERLSFFLNDCDYTNNELNLAIHFALENNHLDCICEIIPHASRIVDELRKKATIQAASANHLLCFTLLSELHDVDHHTQKECYMQATENGSAECLELLLESYPIDQEMKDDLLLIAAGKHPSCVELLLKYCEFLENILDEAANIAEEKQEVVQGRVSLKLLCSISPEKLAPMLKNAIQRGEMNKLKRLLRYNPAPEDGKMDELLFLSIHAASPAALEALLVTKGFSSSASALAAFRMVNVFVNNLEIQQRSLACLQLLANHYPAEHLQYLTMVMVALVIANHSLPLKLFCEYFPVTEAMLYPALHHATINGSTECLQYLLQTYPIELEVRDHLLPLATEKKYADCVQLIMWNGPISEVILDDAAEIATRNQDRKTLKILCDMIPNDLVEMLNHALMDGQPEKVKRLLRYSLTPSDADMDNLLLEAVRLGETESLEALLETKRFSNPARVHEAFALVRRPEHGREIQERRADCLRLLDSFYPGN
jgi:hypothetical protein